MNSFNGKKKLEIIPTILTIIALDIVGVAIIYILDSYLMLNLIKMALLICNMFFAYHIAAWFTVKYEITKSEIKICCLGGMKKVVLPIGTVESYTVGEGKIKGIGLSGISSHKFAIGRIAVKGLGTTRMFVTNNDRVIYLKTKNPNDVNYAISPKASKEFEACLNDANIFKGIWEKGYNKAPKLYKEKQFMIPLFITSFIILIITFVPLLLYIMNRLPDIMPLVLSASQGILEVGTDTQFAFSQMTYGLLNMAVLFCMYYAAYFCAKYDKKAAYRYIYISLLLAITFLCIQVRLITTII